MTKDDAIRIANSWLSQERIESGAHVFGSETETAVDPENALERWYGWVFSVRLVLQPTEVLFGEGPLIVRRDSGEVLQLGSAAPWDDVLRTFEESLEVHRKE